MSEKSDITLSKDVIAGLIFIGIGVAFGAASLNYDTGTAFRMGPGYFPLVLSGIVILLGIIMMVPALPADVPWRGIVLIIGGLTFFGLTVRGLGLGPSLFITAWVSAFASRQTGIVGASLIAAILTAICLLIFVWGLGMPLDVIGPWPAAFRSWLGF